MDVVKTTSHSSLMKDPVFFKLPRVHFPDEFNFSARAQLRPLEFRDLSPLEWKGGPDLRSFYEAMWRDHCDNLVTVVVLDVGAFPCGQVVIRWSGKPNHLDFPDLQSLRVHPAFQGLGFGSRLIKCSEGLVSKRGYRNVGLSVGVENHSARRLYERLGYRTSGTPYDDHWSFTNAQGETVELSEHVIDMVKALRQSAE